MHTEHTPKAEHEFDFRIKRTSIKFSTLSFFSMCKIFNFDKAYSNMKKKTDIHINIYLPIMNEDKSIAFLSIKLTK